METLPPLKINLTPEEIDQWVDFCVQRVNICINPKKNKKDITTELVEKQMKQLGTPDPIRKTDIIKRIHRGIVKKREEAL